MTKFENVGYRPSSFSKWIRRNLPDSSTGFAVADIDWVLVNWKQKPLKFMFLEEKTGKGYVNKWFKTFIKTILHPAVKQFAENNDDVEYLGFHVLQMEGESPADGEMKFDGKPIDAFTLKMILSLNKQYLKDFKENKENA